MLDLANAGSSILVPIGPARAGARRAYACDIHGPETVDPDRRDRGGRNPGLGKDYQTRDGL